MSARAWLGLGAACAACLVLGGCGEDECTPADFRGGFACGPEAGQFQSCQLDDCGGTCSMHWTIDVQYCTATAPNCVQLDRGQVICLGDVLGPCLTPGFVHCEDLMTQISCVSDGRDGLVLTRGTCAVGARCNDPGAPSSPGTVGCDPQF
jgi:hypothetical protein